MPILIFVLILIFAPGLLLYLPAAIAWVFSEGGFFTWMLVLAGIGGAASGIMQAIDQHKRAQVRR